MNTSIKVLVALLIGAIDLAITTIVFHFGTDMMNGQVIPELSIVESLGLAISLTAAKNAVS